MIKTLATVSEVKPITNEQGITTEYQLTLRCGRSSSCQGCSAKEECGFGVVNRALPSSHIFWDIPNPTPLDIGTQVEIGIAENALMKNAAIMYLLPIVLLVLGAVIGDFILVPHFHLPEMFSIVTSFVFMGIGFFVGRYYSKHKQQSYLSSIQILRVVGKNKL